MSRDYYIGCAECRRKVHLGNLGPFTPRLDEGEEAAGRILDFITKHQGCEGGVVAGDDSEAWKDDGVSDWPDDHDEPTMRAARFILYGPEAPPPSLEDHLEALGLPLPTMEEKRAIFEDARAHRKNQDGILDLHRTGNMLESTHDHPQEPR